MSVVEASDASESTDDSVQYVGSSNPLVEGEVLAENTENPTAHEEVDVYPGFRQAEIEAADHLMQEHTTPEETNIGQEPVQSVQIGQAEQQPEPVTVAQTTEHAAIITQRSGSTASAEQPGSAKITAGTKRKAAKSESEETSARELQKARAKIARQKELLKESRKAEREARERAQKLTEERNQQLQKELDELRAARSPVLPQ